MNDQTQQDQPQRVALVTGASSGIGRETALRLAGAGWAVAAAARREDRLQQLADEAQGQIVPFPVDLADYDAAAGLVDRVLERFDRLDAIVNNAGLALAKPIEKTTREDFDACIAINALAPAAIISRAWGQFRKQKGGRIVNLSSYATLDPFPGFFAYGPAKAAAESLARVASNEGKKFNVKTFSVAPGAVETDMLRGMFDEKTVPPSYALDPTQIAAVICDCLEGRRDNHAGKTIYVKRQGDAIGEKVA